MIYAISFRIEHDTTWDNRWSTLVERIRRHGGGTGETWEETTSFFLIQSNLTTDALALDLFVHTSFDSTKDKLLVINLSNKTQQAYGVIEYPNTLASMLSRR